MSKWTNKWLSINVAILCFSEPWWNGRFRNEQLSFLYASKHICKSLCPFPCLWLKNWVHLLLIWITGFKLCYRLIGFFERVTKALNVVTPDRCRVYFRSVRQYLQLYSNGVTGPEIPKAMSQMRKHRKHRASNLLDDEDSQRGRNSSKRTRLEKLKSQSWNKSSRLLKYYEITSYRHTIPSWTVQFFPWYSLSLKISL